MCPSPKVLCCESAFLPAVTHAPLPQDSTGILSVTLTHWTISLDHLPSSVSLLYHVPYDANVFNEAVQGEKPTSYGSKNSRNLPGSICYSALQYRKARAHRMTFREKTRKSAANLGTGPRSQSPLVDLGRFPLAPLKRPMGCVDVRHPENSRQQLCCSDPTERCCVFQERTLIGEFCVQL